MNPLRWFEGKIFDWALGRIKRSDDEARKRALLQAAVAHLFNTITADDILRQRADGQWMLRGRPLTLEEMNQLRMEAVDLQKMKIWQVLRLDAKYQIGKRVFEEAKVPLDVVWGQLLTFYDDILVTRLKRIGALMEK